MALAASVWTLKLIVRPQRTWKAPFSNARGFAGILPGSCENVPGISGESRRFREIEVLQQLSRAAGWTEVAGMPPNEVSVHQHNCAAWYDRFSSSSDRMKYARSRTDLLRFPYQVFHHNDAEIKVRLPECGFPASGFCSACPAWR